MIPNSALRALALEFKSLQEEPVEGFRVKLVNEDHLFEWEVAIFGPPETLYEGGYFKARVTFPQDYPYNPPVLKFLTKVWHPNVYENGDLCISILHPPIDDPQSGELPCERWNPTQNVRTVLLSVISLLNEPNTFSPANVDASARVTFPQDYPYNPPVIKFLTKVWHPNVYENGDLCISILHPPIDDPQSGELPCERWNPTQNVRTVLLSVISLLNEPNTFSPANVDASVMYRRWKESKGRDKEYENIIKKQVTASRLEAEKDNVVVPLTLEEYCIKHRTKPNETEADMTDFYDDDYGDDMEDDDEDDDYNEDDNEDNEDSGNGES
ncbi:unnamed protein product [Medioppia subpectinata]|uniref:UBC core domain-containing protein n=1 Tax=Medioppia subpectinata TaxID=1979941 RepID=A0A7R9PZS2_9ACAR|nr:unnamed protein product [Medioppia subpectinata]CAG2106472.1 unnamed protein product [Medioppia subpectinata]